MSRNTFFVSAIITLCSSLIMFSNAPKLVITRLEDAFVLIPNLLITQPVATFMLVLSLSLFYKALKSPKKY